MLQAFARRIWAVLALPRDAVVVIEYELLPWFPAVFERWLVWRGARMVVDYDDALFHQYDVHPNRWVRRLLGEKIAMVMRLAHTVTVGNTYLAVYARRAGSSHVEVIPTVIDLARYPLKDDSKDPDIFKIGWIGSPITAPYIRHIAPSLEQVCGDGCTRIRLVGSGPIGLAGLPIDLINWSEDTEVEEIRRFDVGIMPLPDESWTRGKCGFKLIQYMACGLPVVASPVGVNAEIVEHGVNGFLSSTQGEWIEALTKLREDPALRQRMGQAGRALVERKYCTAVTTPKYLATIESATR